MFKLYFLIFLVIAVEAVKINPVRDQRILGGEYASLGQVPYMVSIRALHSTLHFAGGALISEWWVLTAAHYLLDRAPTSLNLVLGIVDLPALGQLRHSLRIEINPFFDRFTRRNDIALVQMTAPAFFNSHVSPIYLLSTHIGEMDARVSGFGATAPGGGINSQRLNRLSVRTLLTCPDPPAGSDNQINANNICARGVDGTGICTTDVGGPLASLNGLIGIASWHSKPCGTNSSTTPGTADVYVRISSFRNWIRQTANV